MRLGLGNGNLNWHSAVTIIAAVETFAKQKASDRECAVTLQSTPRPASATDQKVVGAR
jgi:hypothetical protein